MTGRCPDCDTALKVNDMSETFRCPRCGCMSHPEFLRPLTGPRPKAAK